MSERPPHYDPSQAEWQTALYAELRQLHDCVNALAGLSPQVIALRLEHIDERLDTLECAVKRLADQLSGMLTWQAAVLACGKMAVALLPYLGTALGIAWFISQLYGQLKSPKP